MSKMVVAALVAALDRAGQVGPGNTK